MNRRTFLKQVGMAGAAMSAFTPVFSGLAQAQPARVRKVALIGSGWYGKIDLLRLLQVEPVEVVGLCDVDSNMLSNAADLLAAKQKSGKRPHTFKDYRDLLKNEQLDIALIATPDHWHALMAIEAMKAGAHIYLQKPVSLDVVESQAIVAAARKHNRVIQVGLQRRSTPHLIEARDLIRNGKLGKVKMVELCCYYPMSSRDNPPDIQPPANLDWEFYTGPAPMRPYNSMVHPRGWRRFMEYGNGIVGDMCVHMLDMARWMLEVGPPLTVSSTGGILMNKEGKSNIADTQTAMFDFGDVQMVWQHRTWGSAPDPKYPWAAVFYGESGTLKASVFGYDLIPRDGAPVHKDVTMELEEYPEDKTEKDLERHVAPAIRRHMKDFLKCIDEGGRPVSNIEEGATSTIACILANLSMGLKRSITWDHATGTIKGDAEASRLLKRPYRSPWVHPGVS